MSQGKDYSWKAITTATFDQERTLHIPIDGMCGRINATRERLLKPETNEYRTLWTKEYIKSSLRSPQTAEEEHKSLLSQAFAPHELKILGHLGRQELKFVSGPNTIEENFSKSRTSNIIVKTYDAGPSLDYWLKLDQFSNPPIFSDPVVFLRLARGILQALEEFHRREYLHLDINMSNICMPVKNFELKDDLMSATVKPDWDGIKLIDFAYSISKSGRGIYPNVLFPHNFTKSFNEKVGKFVKELEKEVNIKGVTARNPVIYNSLYNQNWWESKSSRVIMLEGFLSQLDWREDIYKLGEELDRIKIDHSVSSHHNHKINNLVDNLPGFLRDAGGSSASPHNEWIWQIDEALNLCLLDKEKTNTFKLVNPASNPTPPIPTPKPDDPVPIITEPRPIPHTDPSWLQRTFASLASPVTGLNQTAIHVFAYLASVAAGFGQFARSVLSAFLNNRLLTLLTLCYAVFVLTAVALGKDFIGLPLGATAALVMLIVSGVVVWKYTGALVRGAARCFMVVRRQFRHLSYGLHVRFQRGWYSVIALWDKLDDFLYNDGFMVTVFFGSIFVGFAYSFLFFGGAELLQNLISGYLDSLIHQQDIIEKCNAPDALKHLGHPGEVCDVSTDNRETWKRIKELAKDMLIISVIIISPFFVCAYTWVYCSPPLRRGAARLIMALKNLSLRLSGNLRAYFRSRKIYPILLPIFLVPLAWTAENQYDLIAQTQKTYETWHQARDYAEASQKIELGGWWIGRREADSQESAWLDTTRQLAGQDLPQAQFMMALTRCYGMQDGGKWTTLNLRNAENCGPQLSAALQNGARRWHRLSNSVGWSDMLDSTQSLLKITVNVKTVYKLEPPPGTAALARAIVSGLEAAAPFNDPLAFELAKIQACWMNPPQKDAARRTLRELAERSPDNWLVVAGDVSKLIFELGYCKP